MTVSVCVAHSSILLSVVFPIPAWKHRWPLVKLPYLRSLFRLGKLDPRRYLVGHAGRWTTAPLGPGDTTHQTLNSHYLHHILRLYRSLHNPRPICAHRRVFLIK